MGKKCTFHTIIVISSFCHISIVIVCHDHDIDIQIEFSPMGAQSMHQPRFLESVPHIITLINRFIRTITIRYIYVIYISIASVYSQWRVPKWILKTPQYFHVQKHAEIIWTQKCTVWLEFGISECFVFKFFYSSPENEFTCHRHWLYFQLHSYMYILNSMNISMSYIYYIHKHGSVVTICVYIYYNCITYAVTEVWGGNVPLQYK